MTQPSKMSMPKSLDVRKTYPESSKWKNTAKYQKTSEKCHIRQNQRAANKINIRLAIR